MSKDIQVAIDQRMAAIKQHPTLCMWPYLNLGVRIDTYDKAEISQSCCCNLDIKKFVAVPGPDPFAEIKQIQKQGQWPAACKICKDEEDNGGVSERLREFLSRPLTDIEQFIESQQTENFTFNIKFSNLCNLACRSCNSLDSSTFAKISNDPVPPGFDQDISESQMHWDFITKSILEKHNQGRCFSSVFFIGGETLIQPGMHKMLNWMIDQNIASKIILKITTALTVNPSPELLEKLSHFHSIIFMLSIDSVGKNYSYVRWPARFEKIQTNLDTLLNFSSASRNNNKPLKWEYWVTPVFSLNNIFYINDWLDYWHQWYQQNECVFYSHSLTLLPKTVHLDVQALPLKYRAPLIELLRTCLDHDIFNDCPRQLQSVYNFIKTTIVELETAEENQVLWQKYLTHTSYFDKKTNMDFAVLNQRLYDLLSTEDQQLFNTIKLNTNTQESLTVILDSTSIIKTI